MKQIKISLDRIKEALAKDLDWLHIVTGYEGVGKTTLALDMCFYIDPNFNINKIVFSSAELIKAVRNSKPGEAILVDEGALVFFSRDSMTKAAKQAVKLLTGMRTYNLFLCICVPDFFILDKYIRDHRVRSVCNVTDRGMANFYFNSNVRKIDKNKKTNRIVYPGYNYRDYFPAFSGPLWEQYLEKKKKLVLDNNDEKEKVLTKKEMIINMIKKNMGTEEIASIVKTDPAYVRQIHVSLRYNENTK